MKPRAALTLLSVFVLLGAFGPTAGAGPHRVIASSKARLQMYEVVVDPATAGEIEASGYDVASEEPAGTGMIRLVLVLYPWERQGLEKQGVSLTLWRNDSGLTATKLAAAQKAAGFKVWRPYDGPNGFRAYMTTVANANPDLLKLEVLGTTGQGRDIVALKLTKNARTVADNARPAVLYSSLQHAREWVSGEVTRRLLVWLIKRYREADPRVVKLLRTTELWFVPVANPDGYQYTFDGDRLWRKNLRDNDLDGSVGPFDGVDPNRNYPEHWNFDDEGSEGIFSSETYRGPSAGSEPETQAIMSLYDAVDFRFHVNYHSFGQLLLYSTGWQVQTPSADDPIFVALSGTDKKPAINAFDPGVGADLYITNGETTDFAHAIHGTLAWTPELSEGPNGDGFVFPDSNGAVENEFKDNLPFALAVARSAADPDDPISPVGIKTQPFYLDVSQIDPQKTNNPLSDFSFAQSFGDPQPVEILAKRDLNGDGAVTSADDVAVHWSVNGGPTSSASTDEWQGGERYGADGDVYYRIVRGIVTGFDTGDSVKVWFSGGGETSESFTFTVVTDSPDEVLILAAEDRTGPANTPTYPSATSPNYLHYYTAALDANGISWDVYDVDAMGRTAPDHTGVLSHYDAVVWYTGNDYLTREPGQVPGTGASTLANTEVLQVRAYLNEGGRLLYTGAHAGWQYANAYEYNPVSTPPFCDGTIPAKTGVACQPLSDDFLQYWLGANLFIEDGGTDPSTGLPFGIGGTDSPFTGASWTLNGGDSANNQLPNPVRGTTQSFLTTDSLLKSGTYPQFAGSAPAAWQSGVGGAFSPHTGSRYAYSDRGDVSYKRLMTTVAPVVGDDDLTFWVSYDTELDWDYMFVEAHTPGQDDWVTLPDQNGHTGSGTGESCPEGWHALHPSLVRYQGADCSGAAWNAATGRSPGWEPWSVDLSHWDGASVEVSISYASDWAVQGLGVFVDDVDTPGSSADTGFESDLAPWTVPGAPPENPAPNPNDWFASGDVGFEEGAVVTMSPAAEDFRTMYLGFAFEAITDAADRADVMGQAMAFLLDPS